MAAPYSVVDCFLDTSDFIELMTPKTTDDGLCPFSLLISKKKRWIKVQIPLHSGGYAASSAKNTFRQRSIAANGVRSLYLTLSICTYAAVI